MINYEMRPSGLEMICGTTKVSLDQDNDICVYLDDNYISFNLKHLNYIIKLLQIFKIEVDKHTTKGQYDGD